MWLAKTSIKRPVFATMFIMALVVLGLVSYPEIGVDLLPKVEFPIVSVTTVLKGASPEVMDVDVTDKIEEAVNTIEGVKTITSTSREGVSTVTIEFVLERNIDLAVQDVREKVSMIRSNLPTDIDEPIIQKVDPDSNPILWIVLTGQKSTRELSTYMDETLKDLIQRIQGVGALRIGGLQLREVRVWLDADKLRAYQIAPSDVATALIRENVELPGGRIESKTKEYSIKIKGEFPQAGDFNDLIVAYVNQSPVRIRDIGRAEDGQQEKRSIVRFDGVTGIGVGVQKQSGTNTVEVIDRIKKEIREINKTLPPGMKLQYSFDQSTFIKRSIKEVQGHLILGGILAILAVFLFLRNVRTTLISGLALPVSVISTFTIMRAFGFTFNNMTMLALTLSVGLLIDDAIIVIENIYRHVEEGMPPREAADFATTEIGLAVTATTLAIIVIFLPVAFMKGIIGRFFMQFALTVVFSVAVSLVVSFTLTPMLASLYLKQIHNPGPDPETAGPGRFAGLSARMAWAHKAGDGLEKGYKQIEVWYRRLLELSLRHRGIVLVLALLLFLFSLYITKFIGKEFVPPEDQGQFIVRLEGPMDYSVDRIDDLFRQAEDVIRKTPEVTGVFYAQGLGRGGVGEINKAFMFITLAPKAERTKSQEQLKAEFRRKFQAIPGLKGTAEDVSFVGGGIRNVPILYAIRGTSMTDLQTYTRQITADFAKVPGVVDVDTTIEAGKPELKIFIDRDKAADLGVSVGSIAEAINILMSGEVDITKYKDEERGRRYDVRVRLNPEDRSSPSDLGRLYVRAKDGRLVELASVTRVQEGGGPSAIYRVDRQRATIMYAGLENKPLAEAMDALNAISARILPSDYTARYKGAADTMKESFGFLLFALFLGIAMAYMILAAQFESFVHPVTVLLSMPLSFIGAFGALLLTGKTISIYSLIGIILLMGLVKKNAILLVDYTNTLRARGMARREAILQAGPVRLRPILMTTFAMVFGMIPVALGVGEGAETRSPMGIAVIGGLLASLFLTLVVVPAAYDLFDDWLQKLHRGNRVSPEKGGTPS
jgi:hydrophobic/amphiphilic exporter-1 (mainly G- bacteria), HAE1 family